MNLSNQAVDTTAASPRLFHIETSKLTNPEVVAMTEAAVVSPSRETVSKSRLGRGN